MERLRRVAEHLHCGNVSADGARRPMVPDDMGALIALEAPQLSPCGTWLAYCVATPQYEDNRHDKQIVLTAVSGGETKPFTFDRVSCGSPQWSPSGDVLSFLDKAADGSMQVFELAIGGGDARQVSSLPGGVLAFEWSPTGLELALAAVDQPPELEGEDKHDKTFHVGDDNFLTDAAPLPHHLWLQPAAGGDATRLTSGEKGLAQGMGFAWLPDGSALVYPAQENPSLSCGNRRSLEVLPIDGAPASQPVIQQPACQPASQPATLTAYQSPLAITPVRTRATRTVACTAPGRTSKEKRGI
jgi:hypothetical protein